MEITIDFQDGPIEAEITADEDDDYQQVLEALSEFVDGYTPTGSTETDLTNGSGDEVGREDREEEDDEATSLSGSNGLSNLRDVPDDELYRLVKIGKAENGDISEHPRIIGDRKELGDTETEKILNASIVILTVLDDFHDMDTMKTSELKQALADSGLNDDNFGNIDKLDEADIYLNRRGRGPSATTEIRPPGKDEAYRIISNIVEAE